MSPWLPPLCVLCLLGVAAPGCSNRGTPPLVAQTSGTIAVDRLSAPVSVVRDRWGVPHIYAQSRDDLFFAQGFVQAQDRLFQMDLWRRSAQGRLSEVLGANFIERDAMTRRVQYRGDLDAEWRSYGDDARAIADAFTRGVNAWVARARARPPEEFVLAAWLPEFWSPIDLLNRTDAFLASGPVEGATLEVVADAVRRIGTPPFFVGLAAPLSGTPDPADRRPDPTRHRLDSRALPVPSTRYLVHLNGAGWNAIGATAPWLPGIAAGHDDRIDWTVAAGSSRAPRIVVVKVNPDNPRQVEHDGRWVDVRVAADAVVVKRRGKPFMFETELTPDGVVVATDRERHLAFALQWDGLNAGAGGLRALAPVRAPFRGTSDLVLGTSARVLFSHVLGITDDARRRFDVGPLAIVGRPPAIFDATFDRRDWDRSTAILAPGQSESPASPHYADLAPRWASGDWIPLWFSDAAVRANAEATLTLEPSARR